MSSYASVQKTNVEVFWGEIAPCDHMAQFYEDDDALLDSLSGFIGGGLRVGDGAIVIATVEHLKGLNDRLEASGVDVAAARSQDQYIQLVAQETLDRFIVKQWPDDVLFADLVTEVIARARGNGRRVRAFGEMVALLWARGDYAATVRLETLWHNVCQKMGFSLLCAYPKVGLTVDTAKSMDEIFAAHSRIV